MSLTKLPLATLPDATSLQEFCDLLGARTGLQVRDKDREVVARALMARSAELKTSVSSFIQLLRQQPVDGGEWARLIPTLTNGESYFERDKGQFALLKDTILPKLIERRRAQGERTLRLWSAGCSTGEEAYSLAIAVDSVLPRDWQATVLGTDINAEALKKARSGVYGAWSFRGVEAATRNTYFQPTPEGYQLSRSLRERVQFDFCNLSAPDWPDAARGIRDMDLIVCRNVLIYFRRATVADVLSRFARTLRPGGFLVTGHAELHDQNVAPLKARLFPESAVYQKEEDSNRVFPEISRDSKTRTNLPQESPKSRSLQPGALSAPAAQSISRTTASRANVSTPPPQNPRPSTSSTTTSSITAEQWCQQARQHANSGSYEEAMSCCRHAIKASASHPDVYLIWAQIAEEQGQTTEAKELLKKVIYLAPSHPAAYVELAAIYEAQGDNLRARQMRLSALELLRSAPTSGTEPSRAALMQHLENLLSDGATSTSKPDARGEHS